MEELSILGYAALAFMGPPLIISVIYGVFSAMKK